ncbi:MAG: WYL domain-containing protein [Candidatus Sungbacteria bacterium]|nr:WYL domain-containing protein [Candidatus Sungbacteria bacterium]
MSDTLVIDLETKKSFADVGGRDRVRDLGVSVAGAYSYAADAFFAFEEPELGKLESLIRAADRVIGFNIKQFDLPVLEPYLSDAGALRKIIISDMYEDAVNFLGHRVGLNALAKATLGVSKSGDGLEALRLFKEGHIEEVKRYCLDDVRITRDLWEYGKTHGHVLFESFTDGKVHSVPVAWGGAAREPVSRVIDQALAKRRRLQIEYISSEDSDGLGFKKSRLIDVYHIKPNGDIEAYCHLRRGVREFRMARIMSAELTNEAYALPEDSQSALFV